MYLIYLKYWARQAQANSVDLDQGLHYLPLIQQCTITSTGSQMNAQILGTVCCPVLRENTVDSDKAYYVSLSVRKCTFGHVSDLIIPDLSLTELPKYVVLA